MVADWTDFGQVDLQGAPAAVLRADGLAFVAMATRSNVRTWAQDTPNGGWEAPQVRVAEGPNCSPGLAPGEDDRLYCFYRIPDGEGRFIVEGSIGGDFSDPTSLGEDDGVGGIAALRADGVGGRIFLAQRTFTGAIHVAWQDAPNGDFEDWVDLGGMAIGSPALIADAGGLPVLLMHAGERLDARRRARRHVADHVGRLGAGGRLTGPRRHPSGKPGRLSFRADP